MRRSILVSCGEASGDLYAAELLRELKALDGEIDCFGLGGDRLRAEGADILVSLEEISVIGLVEVLGKLPALYRAKEKLLAAARRRRPDAAVLIDFSGFNLRLGRHLRALEVPIVYYVSPQVWAWRRRRVRTIRRLVDKMLVIVPFEEDFYRRHGVPADFVGHPLVDLVRVRERRETFCRRVGLDPHRPLIGLLPGSRRREVELHVPVLSGAVERMAARRPDLQFVLLKAPTVDRAEIDSALRGAAKTVKIVEGATCDGLAHAAVAVVASGTATLEAALVGTPMVVVYRVGWLSYVLGKPFVRVPHYAMVNLIAERRLVPELIQGGFTEQAVAAEALRLLEDEPSARAMRRGLEQVRARLGGGGASLQAAEKLMSVITARRAG